MPRKVLIFTLLITLTLLISLMGWFSVRLYKMEQRNADNLLLREHENTLNLTLWELETRALSLYNNCIAELSSAPEERLYVKEVYTISTSPDLPGDLSKLRSLNNVEFNAEILKTCHSVHETAQNTPFPTPDPTQNEPLLSEDNKKRQTEPVSQQSAEYGYAKKKNKAWNYDNRKETVNQQIIAMQNVATKSKNPTNLEYKQEVNNQPLQTIQWLTQQENTHPFQAGWVEDQLYLFRLGMQKGTLETVLLDHTEIYKKLRENQPDITLSASDRPFITLKEGKVTLISPETIPYAENTLITLPYQLILPFPPKSEMDLNWLKTLAITWVALLLTIFLAGLFILSLIRLSKRRSEFVSSVTHELRTPLTSFQLYAEMLRDNLIPSEEKRIHYLNTLSREASRLSHLVENVLTYSQIERGKVRKSSSPLSDLLPPIIDRLKSRVEETSATLAIRNPLPPETILTTDPTAVEQILFNLVDNACKYALEESPEQEILLTLSRSEKTLNFSLSDEGPGISKKEHKKLFHPFHKSAEKAADTAKPGVGLGLSIAKRQAKLLGGKLTLSQPCEHGCTFILSLPL